jgi:hypothetical protein
VRSAGNAFIQQPRNNDGEPPLRIGKWEVENNTGCQAVSSIRSWALHACVPGGRDCGWLVWRTAT